MKKIIFCLITAIATTSCTHHVSETHLRSDSDLDSENAKNYAIVRSMFDPSLTDHFPDKVAREGSIFTSEDTREQYVGITMIDYNVDPPNTSKEGISQVDPKCIIPFETISTLTELTKDCSHLVIPSIDNSRFKGFDDGFRFYLAKQTDLAPVQKYTLEPNSTSIESLKHGYSKGIAYNPSSRVAVYWAIIW